MVVVRSSSLLLLPTPFRRLFDPNFLCASTCEYIYICRIGHALIPFLIRCKRIAITAISRNNAGWADERSPTTRQRQQNCVVDTGAILEFLRIVLEYTSIINSFVSLHNDGGYVPWRCLFQFCSVKKTRVWIRPQTRCGVSTCHRLGWQAQSEVQFPPPPKCSSHSAVVPLDQNRYCQSSCWHCHREAEIFVCDDSIPDTPWRRRSKHAGRTSLGCYKCLHPLTLCHFRFLSHFALLCVVLHGWGAHRYQGWCLQKAGLVHFGRWHWARWRQRGQFHSHYAALALERRTSRMLLPCNDW